MLEGRRISVVFDGRSVLDDVSLAVAPGERVQIAAPSGTGKTTLCRVLAGYLAPQAGEVLVDGAPLPKRGVCPVQLVGQHPERALDPRLPMEASLREVLDARTRFRSERRKRCESSTSSSRPASGSRPASDSRPASSSRSVSDSRPVSDLRPMGCAPLADADIQGLLEELGIQRRWLSRYPHELSGGELQRFCIARALLACPRYLIADEISTMLDAVTQAQIWSVLLAEAETRDMGLVFVSHSPALSARLATRVVELAAVRG